MVEEAKDSYLAYIIQAINGMKLSDFIFGDGDGWLKQNTLVISQSPKNVHFSTLNNTFTLNITKFSMNFVSQEFKYSFWFIPITGNARIKMTDVNLIVTVQLTTQ